MNTTQTEIKRKKWKWLRFIWGVPVVLLTLTGILKLIRTESLIANFEKLNAVHLMIPLGLVQLLSTVLFLIPKTRRLGFLFLTAYIGGIIATKAIHDTVGIGLLLMVLLWVGMYFEDRELFAIQ